MHFTPPFPARRMHAFERVAALLSLACLVLLMAGCGTTSSQTRVSSVTVKTEWVEDKTTPRTIVFGAWGSSVENLTIRLSERYTEREFSYTETRYERRRVTQPNLGFAVATAGLGCVVATAECVGKATDWQDNGSQQSNRAATGNSQVRERANRMRVEMAIQWSAYDKAGALIAKRPGTIRASESAAIPVRSFVMGLPREPERLEVELVAQSVDGRPLAAQISSPVATFGRTQIAGLNIKLEGWLSAEERMALYSKDLRERLLAQDWRAANLVFSKLESLGTALPPSFSYRYGENLIRSGDATKAQPYLRRYLSQAGADGEFSEKARALLGN